VSTLFHAVSVILERLEDRKAVVKSTATLRPATPAQNSSTPVVPVPVLAVATLLWYQSHKHTDPTFLVPKMSSTP
jgi:hypothetical protein